MSNNKRDWKPRLYVRDFHPGVISGQDPLRRGARQGHGLGAVLTHAHPMAGTVHVEAEVLAIIGQRKIRGAKAEGSAQLRARQNRAADLHGLYSVAPIHPAGSPSVSASGARVRTVAANASGGNTARL